MTRPLEEYDPRRVGAYSLEGRLGAGGQGVVFLGRSDAGVRVAVKLLHIHEQAARTRFMRELDVAKRVSPFCTAQVLDAEMSGDRLFIVSEYVAGPTLAEQVRDGGPLSGAELDRLAIGTATALAAVHAAGVVHRDFKPGNVIMSPSGPRVIDFGIARMLEATSTTVSQVVGTPAYMAPEQVAGGRIGQSVDVFAWAGTMLFAATGRAPFDGGTIPVIFNQILNEQPDLTPLGDGTLRRLVAECLAKDESERPSSENLLLRLMRGDAPLPGPESVPAPQDAAALLDEGQARAAATTIIEPPPPAPAAATGPPPPPWSAPAPTGPMAAPAPNGPVPTPAVTGPVSAPGATGPISPPGVTGPVRPVRPAASRRRRPFIPVVAAVAAVVAVVAGGLFIRQALDDGGRGSSGSDAAAKYVLPQQLRTGGTLRIVTDATYEPMEFMRDGKPVGFDIDLGSTIARRFGLRPEFVNAAFDSLIPKLNARSGDIVMSAMTDTAERQKVLGFVDYLSDGSALLVRKGNPARLAPGDFSVCGKRIAVIKGSTEDDALSENGFKGRGCKDNGLSAPLRTVVPTMSMLVSMVSQGAVDGALTSLITVGYQARKSSGALIMAGGSYGLAPLGIGFRKDEAVLGRALRQVVNDLIADGTYARLADTWGLTAAKRDQATLNGATA